MADLDDRWEAYARLQTELSQKDEVDSACWGLEAALARLLRSPSTDEELQRAARSESRRERHRARLRAIHLANAEIEADPEARLDARRGLRVVWQRVSQKDWALLVAIGNGNGYGELVAELGSATGHLRVRVMRLRRELPRFIAEDAA